MPHSSPRLPGEQRHGVERAGRDPAAGGGLARESDVARIFRWRAQGSRGPVEVPSLRRTGGTCFAALWPNVVTPPSQGDHFRYHWNGRKVDLVQRLTGDKPVFSLP